MHHYERCCEYSEKESFYDRKKFVVPAFLKRFPGIKLWILEANSQKLKNMLKDIFIKGMTYRAVGEKYGYSDAGLWLMLKRETEKYL